jgi:hypothetical protein
VRKPKKRKERLEREREKKKEKAIEAIQLFVRRHATFPVKTLLGPPSTPPTMMVL